MLAIMDTHTLILTISKSACIPRDLTSAEAAVVAIDDEKIFKTSKSVGCVSRESQMAPDVSLALLLPE
jgi:hypothetical protein